MRVLDDDHRVTFLREVQRQLKANWQPVIDAIVDGRATHLTDLDQDGILSSPLGLSIAARAYSPTAARDESEPAELLDGDESWNDLLGELRS